MVLRLPLLLLADDYFVLGCFPGIQGDGDAGVCLFFGDDKDAVKAAYAVDYAKGVIHKIVVVFHVAQITLYHIVVVARCVVAFHHLANPIHLCNEFLAQFLAMLFQSYVAEHHEVVAHLRYPAHKRNYGCRFRIFALSLPYG